jgi:hypothetical protein
MSGTRADVMAANQKLVNAMKQSQASRCRSKHNFETLKLCNIETLKP